MKRIYLLSLMMAGLSFSTQASAASTETLSPPPENAALSEVILHRIALVSQRNNHFTETRQLHALKRPLQSEGQLKFFPPDHVEKLTLLPVKDDVVIEGDTMQFQHGQADVRNIPLHLNPTLQIIVDTIRGPLEGNINLLQHYYILKADGNIGQWRLTLTPRTKEVAKIIQIVKLEGHNNVIEHTYLLQTNGDVTDTVISQK